VDFIFAVALNGRWMTDVPATATASGCAASLALAFGLFAFYFWQMAFFGVWLCLSLVLFGGWFSLSLSISSLVGVGMETSIVDSLILWAEVPGR
jgi:hypothetical protein